MTNVALRISWYMGYCICSHNDRCHALAATRKLGIDTTPPGLTYRQATPWFHFPDTYINPFPWPPDLPCGLQLQNRSLRPRVTTRDVDISTLARHWNRGTKSMHATTHSRKDEQTRGHTDTEMYGHVGLRHNIFSAFA